MASLPEGAPPGWATEVHGGARPWRTYVSPGGDVRVASRRTAWRAHFEANGADPDAAAAAALGLPPGTILTASQKKKARKFCATANTGEGA